MVSAISSTTPVRHVAQAAPTPAHKQAKAKSEPRGDTVELSATAQAAVTAHQRAATEAAERRPAK